MINDIAIRLPKITSDNAEGQLAQLQSYVYQLVEQLNWAFTVVQEQTEGGSSEAVVTVDSSGKATPAKESDESIFNRIKSLIIKSAEFINAYYDEIKTQLDGVYVAQSDFGTYAQETQALITQNSTGITQLFTNTQLIESNIDNIENQIIESKAWINSGLLDYDGGGAPIYGIEVGQRVTEGGQETFNKYARFTADGIYFYLPGISTPVAWMSGTKLYITNAEITNTLKLGNYVADLTRGGVTFKYVGGYN